LQEAFHCVADAAEDFLLMKKYNLMFRWMNIHIHLITWKLDVLHHHENERLRFVPLILFLNQRA
jgi:hypothetical protein